MRLVVKETPHRVGRNKGQTDQVPNLEKAGVNTQTRPGMEGELGEGSSWAP